MNASIRKLFVVCVILFTLLVIWTSRWAVFDASALQHDRLNQLGYFRSLRVDRGGLLADDGTVLARSVPAGGGTYTETYPQGSLFAQTVGYYNAREQSAAGLEESLSSTLEGSPTGISSVFGPIDTGTQVGNEVQLTLDPRAQRLARSLLAGRVGSVVAITPQTGAVDVMYSNPSYNDNRPDACHSQSTAIESFGCQVNLATAGELPPGSTFKIVTSSAALNTGRFTPQSVLNGNSPRLISGIPLHNDANQSWGPVSLTKALTYSINTVYAQVGEAVGKQTMYEYMKRFGFYSVPPLGLPSDELAASGERYQGKLIPPTSPLVDIGRTAIGQDYLTVTPLQMAMVVATVANRGTLMKPYLVQRVISPDGVVLRNTTPTVYHRVMRPSIATELGGMMSDVVEEGTGTAANLQGLSAGGKTGTATVITGQQYDDAWFIGFAPVAHPRIAVAVMLPDIIDGYGGTYAAPIAAQIMRTLIAEGK
jgi:peptidoglycan glycosyltransferase